MIFALFSSTSKCDSVVASFLPNKLLASYRVADEKNWQWVYCGHRRPVDGQHCFACPTVIGQEWDPAECIAWLWGNLVKPAITQRLYLALPRHNDPSWIRKVQQREDLRRRFLWVLLLLLRNQSCFWSFVPSPLGFIKTSAEKNKNKTTTVEVELSVSMRVTFNQTEHLLVPGRSGLFGLAAQLHNAPQTIQFSGWRHSAKADWGWPGATAVYLSSTALPSSLASQFRSLYPSAKLGWFTMCHFV